MIHLNPRHMALKKKNKAFPNDVFNNPNYTSICNNNSSIVKNPSPATESPLISISPSPLLYNDAPSKKLVYVCPYPSCQKIFSRSNKISRHMLTHTNEVNYFNYTPSTIAHFWNAVLYNSLFTIIESFFLLIFAQFFPLTSSLLAKTYYKKKSFRCQYPQCNKTYRRKEHLKVHLLVHGATPEDRKPYPCSEPGCSSRFSTPHHLRRHLKIHNVSKKTNFSNVRYLLHLCLLNFWVPLFSLIFIRYLRPK